MSAKPYKQVKKSVRKQVIHVDQDCQCLFCGKRTALTIDHIKHRSHGGTDDVSNLRGICSNCHNLRHWSEEKNLAARVILAIQIAKGPHHVPLIDSFSYFIFHRFMKKPFEKKEQKAPVLAEAT